MTLHVVPFLLFYSVICLSKSVRWHGNMLKCWTNKGGPKVWQSILRAVDGPFNGGPWVSDTQKHFELVRCPSLSPWWSNYIISIHTTVFSPIDRAWSTQTHHQEGWSRFFYYAFASMDDAMEVFQAWPLGHQPWSNSSIFTYQQWSKFGLKIVLIHEDCLGGLGLFEPRPHTARVLYSFDASAGCLVQELEADAGASVGCLVPRDELSEESLESWIIYSLGN